MAGYYLAVLALKKRLRVDGACPFSLMMMVIGFSAGLVACDIDLVIWH